jgi:dTDP-4-amino-4,6-dideoxy-D-galactose acyltransferase
MNAMPDRRSTEPCEVLPWDSEFWGFPIARVRGDILTPERVVAIDRWCQQRSIVCLYFLATFDDPTTVRCAEDGQFRLVDARVTYHIASEAFASSAHRQGMLRVAIRPAEDADVEALRRIAGESFHDTRFYFDQRFPRAKCRELYERWVVESCRGFADQVLVADRGGAPVGYVTCHLPKGDESGGRIGLINVASEARRLGIGWELRRHALDWFAGQGVPRVAAATQARNIAMQVLNQRSGFVTQTFQLLYHKWYCLPGQAAP